MSDGGTQRKHTAERKLDTAMTFMNVSCEVLRPETLRLAIIEML